MRLEYLNPLVGLVMLIIGIALISSGHPIYGVSPSAVGIFLVVYYKKYLFEILGIV